MDEDIPKENALGIHPLSDLNDSPCGPEAKRPKIQEPEVEIVDLACEEEDEDKKTPEKKSNKGTKTPTTKGKTPRVSKEEREAERLKKSAIRKAREEEKELARQKKEREKREEKERKEREREEKRREEERKKEDKRKDDERRKEEKRKEEEQRKEDKKKEDEKRKEEKRKAEEEKLAKKREEEEKKRREEEAEIERKRRASARFLGFFNKLDKKQHEEPAHDDNIWYRPFQVKPGMCLAPTHRRDVIPAEKNILSVDPVPDVTERTYLESVKGKIPVSAVKRELRAKLFQFHDNYRPPYYGTWRKKDGKICARKPTSPRSEIIDYENDSDADWEDEPSDGEECKSDEEDPDTGDEDSEAEEFLVEPGYLSDGEGADGESEKGPSEDTDARAARLAARAEEWKRRVAPQEKKKVLVPLVLGPSYSVQPPPALAHLRAVVF